jgi:O-acetyl-ADP-ribose deacetylase (regulator of RNase III)
MIKIISGSILTSTEDYICHQVNTQGVMGAGVAKALSDKYPVVKTEYLKFCQAHKGQDILGAVKAVRVSNTQQVLNIFGQSEYGRSSYKIYTDYDALWRAFNTIKSRYHGSTLAFPYGFGCGLANGNWDTVYGMIAECLGDMDVTIYQLGRSKNA